MSDTMTALPAYLCLPCTDAPELLSVLHEVQQALPQDGIDWQPVPTLHCTLVYAPTASETQIEQVIRSVHLPAAIALSCTGLGIFENGDQRALHMACAPSPDLIALQAQIAQACKDAGVALSPYSAPAVWQPHVTLAYLPDGVALPDGIDATCLCQCDCIQVARDNYEPLAEIHAPAFHSADGMPPDALEDWRYVEEFAVIGAVDADRWFRILPLGYFERFDRAVEVTREKIADMVRNFRLGVPGFRLPAKTTHDDTAGKLGNVADLQDRSDGLYARFDWLPYGRARIERGDFQYISPEIQWGSTSFDGRTVQNVLMGVALLNDPFFGEQVAVYSLEDQPMMPDVSDVHVNRPMNAPQKKKRYRKFDTAQRKQLADAGKALPDGSFPIVTVADLVNAMQAIGRSKKPRAQIIRHIKQRGAALVREGKLSADHWQEIQNESSLFKAGLFEGADMAVNTQQQDDTGFLKSIVMLLVNLLGRQEAQEDGEEEGEMSMTPYEGAPQQRPPMQTPTAPAQPPQQGQQANPQPPTPLAAPNPMTGYGNGLTPEAYAALEQRNQQMAAELEKYKAQAAEAERLGRVEAYSVILHDLGTGAKPLAEKLANVGDLRLAEELAQDFAALTAQQSTAALFTEMGTSSPADATKPLHEQFVEEADRIAKEKKIPTTEAFGIVAKEHPDWYKAYRASAGSSAAD